MENPGGEETRGEVRSGDRRQACLSVADAGEPLCGSGESLCRSGGASVGVGEKPGDPETWISRNLDLQKLCRCGRGEVQAQTGDKGEQGCSGWLALHHRHLFSSLKLKSLYSEDRYKVGPTRPSGAG